jgi:hypothetical protein
MRYIILWILSRMTNQISSLLFAFHYKNLISTKAFFYLLNGGDLPKLTYSRVITRAKETAYFQSYLTNSGKQKYRMFNSYFKALPIEGVVLATIKFKKGVETSTSTFYLETLERLAEYNEQTK